MKLKFRIIILVCLIFASLANSCSTGPDPESIIDDNLALPAEACLQIQNIINDIAMEVNGIAMNNLQINRDKITDDVADCLTASVHRNSETSVLDSIVMDYGSTACKSNGASFIGKIIVDPKDENLKQFDIRLKGFSSQGYSSNDTLSFVVGEIAGKNFTLSMKDVEFKLKNGENTLTFLLSTFNSSYTFVRDEEGRRDDYGDDTFQFAVSLTGVMPNGAGFTYQTTSDCTFTFFDDCNQIIGGEADFVLSDLTEGIFNFGSGNPFENCDNEVQFSTKGVSKTFKI